jgi:tetrahydromethanopterin S-methyltransferase subunit G
VANGGGSELAQAWSGFDDATKIRLTVTELDRVHLRINRLHTDLETDIMESRVDFRERIQSSRDEFNAAFVRLEASIENISSDLESFKKEVQSQFWRQGAWALTLLGGIITGLILLVVQIASQ